MGPFPASGMCSAKRSKEEIFSHLADHGITSMVAKHLLDFEESKILAKNDGLVLIEAMNLVITDVNVLTSTWDKVVMFYKLEFNVDFETPEPPDLRITLIPRWIELALRSTRAASGVGDAHQRIRRRLMLTRLVEARRGEGSYSSIQCGGSHLGIYRRVR